MTTVRSVSARLDADVDAYIRDVRRAGKVTRDEFGSLTATAVRDTGTALDQTDARAGKLTNTVGELGQNVRSASGGVKALSTDLGRLDGTASRVDTRLSSLATSSARVGSNLGNSSNGVRTYGSEIDRLSGRLQIVTDLIAVFGPGTVPIGGVLAAGIGGIANQAGFAAAGLGTALLAFQGVGDALEAIEKARLDPTVDNLNAAELSLARLTPAAREFATELGAMREDISGATVDAAAVGLFPGLTRSLDDLDRLLPRGQAIFRELGDAAGDLTADSVESLASPRWSEFFDFLEAEARPTLTDIFGTVGDLTYGLSQLWMATQPLNSDFSSWLRDGAADFADWSAALDDSDGFAEFVAYVRHNGPQVADTLGAVSGAFVDIITAAAPLGGPSLAILEALADTLSVIASSDIGSPLIAGALALGAFNRAMAIQQRLAQGGLFGRTRENWAAFTGGIRGADDRMRAATPSASQFGTVVYRAGQSAQFASEKTLAARAAVRDFAGTAGRFAGPAAGMALAASGLGDDMMGANTATFALMGSMGGLPGALGGAAIGAVLDMAQANDDLEQAIDRANAAAENGSLSQMREEYRSLAEEIADTADTGSIWEETFGGGAFERGKAALFDTFDEGAESLRELRREMDAAEGNSGGLGDLLGATLNVSSGGIRAATSDVEALRESLTRLEGALAGRASWRDYEAAIDAVRSSIKENGKSLDITTESGRANQEVLDNIAATSISVAENLTGMNRIRFLERARDDFVDAGKKFGLTGREARQLADRLGLLDDLIVEPEIRSPKGAPKFEGDVDRIRQTLEGMPEEVTTYMDVNGVPQTRGQIEALRDAYGLTPREVRTLVRLMNQGALRGIRNVDDLLRQLDAETATPTANVNSGPAERGMSRTRSQLRSLNGERATPTLDAQDNASGVIAGVRGQINSLPASRTTYLNVVHTTIRRVQSVLGPTLSGGAGLGNAGAEGMMLVPAGAGRTIRTYAQGGIRAGAQGVAEQIDFPGLLRDPRDRAETHTPELARSGDIRVWRERETRGETYLPLANDHRRPRARAILEETARLFGGNVMWNARGSMSGGFDARQVPVSAGAAVASMTVTGELDTPWGPATVRGIARAEAADAVAAYAEGSHRASKIRASRERDG